ncbi:hypothetical protein BKA70DRAFT_867374 [Coprinopsis sp. MPI-PUGE-AT-0042]|nr:hypothetical protein BKA70DRAFT_867374 [Coprinopsis sp. MPI-PUGE-AT-0042]
MEDPGQRPPTMSPTTLSMVKESGQVSISDSNLTMAGGHVSHIAVNIALNNQPTPEPIPRSLWSRLLGEWLTGPQPSPSLSLAAPSSRVPENTGHNPLDDCILPPPLPTNSHQPAVTYGESNRDIDIVPLDHLDVNAQLALSAAPVRMPHDIYVSHLYPRGHGYPCANPKPWGDPVKIGDIGLMAGDRFNVLENLYSLPESFLFGKPVPAPPIVCDPEIFEEGDCITGGIDACEVKMSETDQTIVDEITVRCHQKEGAFLAVTSPAELREVKNHNALRQYLCENAAQLFECLMEHHAVSRGSSIYVVTGTVMSATWAIATHDTPMHTSHDTLVLKRVQGNQSQTPFFMWRERGNAQTRTQGRQARQNKDQCLFLRGFLITASPAPWTPGREETNKVPTSHPGVQEIRRDQGQDFVHPAGHNGDNGGESFQAGKTATSLSLSLASPFSLPSSRHVESITVHDIPTKTEIANDYPSFRINQTLLDLTGAKFAITHDDDWREAVKRATDTEEICEDQSYVLTVETLREVFPRHVASLERWLLDFHEINRF